MMGRGKLLKQSSELHWIYLTNILSLLAEYLKARFAIKFILSCVRLGGIGIVSDGTLEGNCKL